MFNYINYINVYYFLVIALCVTSMNAEEEEENVSGEDDTKSTESETREDFNKNLKEKLLQLALKELKNETTGNLVFALRCILHVAEQIYRICC